VDPTFSIEDVMLLQIIRHVTTTRLKDPQFVLFVFVMVWIVEKMDVIQVHLVLPRASPIPVCLWDLRTSHTLFHSSRLLVYFWFVFGLMCLGLFCLYDFNCLVCFPFCIVFSYCFQSLSMLIAFLIFYLRIPCKITIGNDKSFNNQLPILNELVTSFEVVLTTLQTVTFQPSDISLVVR